MFDGTIVNMPSPILYIMYASVCVCPPHPTGYYFHVMDQIGKGQNIEISLPWSSVSLEE